MKLSENIAQAVGLELNDAENIRELLAVYNYHNKKNAEKRRYYEGHITLNEVNLGLALPKRPLMLRNASIKNFRLSKTS